VRVEADPLGAIFARVLRAQDDLTDPLDAGRVLERLGVPAALRPALLSWATTGALALLAEGKERLTRQSVGWALVHAVIVGAWLVREGHWPDEDDGESNGGH
jgi:hypothetical protein